MGKVINAVECSCGVLGCRELGWPHEWDPIAAGDTCTIVPPPVFTLTIDNCVHYAPPECTPHFVTVPFERWGSGYACVGCIDIHSDSGRANK